VYGIVRGKGSGELCWGMEEWRKGWGEKYEKKEREHNFISNPILF
jgi:hypothetical protein